LHPPSSRNSISIMKFAIAVNVILTASLFNAALSHSVMTYPEGITAESCAIGGEPQFGPPGTCEGPCDIRLYTGDRAANPWSFFYPPSKPAPKTKDEPEFKRGETITVKYTRNNHGPGGFNRFTLVRVNPGDTGPETAKDYMNKAIHTRNAFHYSCWGANPVVATQAEKDRKHLYHISLVGTDAQQHSFAAGYYTVDITIPPVVPDGLYRGIGRKAYRQRPSSPWYHFLLQ